YRRRWDLRVLEPLRRGAADDFDAGRCRARVGLRGGGQGCGRPLSVSAGFDRADSGGCRLLGGEYRSVAKMPRQGEEGLMIARLSKARGRARTAVWVTIVAAACSTSAVDEPVLLSQAEIDEEWAALSSEERIRVVTA